MSREKVDFRRHIFLQYFNVMRQGFEGVNTGRIDDFEILDYLPAVTSPYVNDKTLTAQQTQRFYDACHLFLQIMIE